MKGRDIRALVDGERVTVVSGKSEKSRVVPLGNVSRQRVKIPIDIKVVGRKRGKDKNLGTGERRRRRGGGRNVRCRGGGREERRRRRKIFNRIHFFVETSAGRESQCQVDNNSENDRADDANGQALCVHGDRRERSGREGNDGDDDSSLSDWLRLYFEGEFHERSQRQRADGRKGLKERVPVSTRVRGRNQGQKRQPKLGRRILDGSSVWAKT